MGRGVEGLWGGVERDRGWVGEWRRRLEYVMADCHRVDSVVGDGQGA